MISYIKGRVIEISDDSLVVESGGVGYRIYSCESIIAAVKESEIVEFFIYSSFSMYDGFKLYGFKDKKHMEIFELLLNSIPNTGARKAIDYLNKILKSTSDFKKAVLNKDIKLLKNLFGFTTKTSEKIIMSLKDKMDKFEVNEREKYQTSVFSSQYETVINALVSLGYKSSDSREALNSVIEENNGKNMTLEELIKFSLRKISGSR